MTAMTLCMSRASAAIVQKVPPTATDWFVKWQRGVSATAEPFDGYQGTDLYPPTGGKGNEWVSVIHFEDNASLEKWIDSPERAEWVERLHAMVGEFELTTMKGGFSDWFAEFAKSGAAVPPWKMALTVLFALYPTVMLLSIFVVPYTSVLGLAFSMLIGNAISVAVLQWILVPALERPLGSWLKAGASQKACTWTGLISLVALLIGMATAFRLMTG